MKSVLLTTLAAALVVPAGAAPALAQAHRAPAHADSHGDHRGQQVSRTASPHRFKRGEKFDRRHATNYRVLNYRDYRRLKAPPRGYHWVRSGDDAVLVGITSGVVSAVVTSMFR